MIGKDYRFVVKMDPQSASKQSGAVEACWAHNPEVRGSKPRSANFFPSSFSFSTIGEGLRGRERENSNLAGAELENLTDFTRIVVRLGSVTKT